MDSSKYYYDPETCRFVEKPPQQTNKLLEHLWLGGIALTVFVVTLWGITYLAQTPEELVLETQNEMLAQQLEKTHRQIREFSTELDQLSQRDHQLYRTLLQTEPVAEDARPVGLGGAGAAPLSVEDASISKLLQETESTLDHLERKIALQNASYRQLLPLAANRQQWLKQLPAILPSSGSVVSGFGMRYHPIYETTRMHEGIDIVVQVGTPIYATGDGVVTFAGVKAGYGKHIRIKHPQTGYESLYAHLSEIPRTIRKGVRVTRGDQIGLSGNSGVSSGPHLHYEVRTLDGAPLDPLYFFAAEMTPQKFQDLQTKTQYHESSLD